MTDQKTVSAIRYFAFYVNHLVDEGFKEEIDVIEDKIDNRDLVEYIGEKYRKQVDFTPFDVSGPYSIESVNESFGKFSGYVQGNESRKFAVSKNGLNLVVALSLELLGN